MRDTTAEAAAEYFQLLAMKSEEERFRMGMARSEDTRRFLLAGLSDPSPAERRVALFERLYGSHYADTERIRIAALIREAASDAEPASSAEPAEAPPAGRTIGLEPRSHK